MLFHISDILSVTTGRCISRDYLPGVINILNYMTGDDIHLQDIQQALFACSGFLGKLYPQLAWFDPVVYHELMVLEYGINKYPEEAKYQALGMVSKVQSQHGLPDMLEVPKLPPGTWKPTTQG